MTEPLFTIAIARTGGVAGLRREWVIEVADVREAARWQPLIEACPWDEHCDDARPDGFSYAVRAAGRTAVLPESALQGPWRRLVDKVQQQAS